MTVGEAKMQKMLNENINTCFIKSVQEKDGMVEQWLKYGADRETFSNNGFTALILAVNSKDIKMVNLLLQKGANVNACNPKNGCSPLMYAARMGEKKILQSLLEFGADPNCRNRHGATAIMEAVNTDDAEIIELLIKYGAEINMRRRDGMTAIMLASRNNKIEIVKCYLKNIKI